MDKERTEFIAKEVLKKSEYAHYYREPMIGYANAMDVLYDELDEKIGSPQIKPTEMLASAKTVIVFFLPYSIELIKTFQTGHKIIQTWSDAYTQTNLLLDKIQKEMMKELKEEGYEVCGEPPTMNYDPIELRAKWSHKSSAVIAGIGTFGLNHLLITKAGTAGRLNSLVTSAYFEPTQRPVDSYCLYYKNGSCKQCVMKCPTGALTLEGFDRFRCNAYLDGKNIHDKEQGCSVCSSGPCAARGF